MCEKMDNLGGILKLNEYSAKKMWEKLIIWGLFQN